MQINIEAVKFFKENLEGKNLPLFFKSRLFKSINLRLFGFEAWRTGHLSFFEFLLNILPNRFKPNSLNQKYYDYLKKIADGIFLKNNIYNKKEILLFGRSFSPAVERTKVDSWLDMFALFFQIIICDQYRANDFLKNNSVVIDAGANIGLFSIMAGTLCPKGKIFAFEPGSIAFAALKKNISTYPNIEAINCGLGDAPGEAKLAIGGGTASNFIPKANYPYKNAEKIKVESIDNFIRMNNLKAVDFIKIDTEGYEKEVIGGAEETIKKFSPVIAVSAYHNPKDRKEIPILIKSIDSSYKYKLFKELEDVFVFWK